MHKQQKTHNTGEKMYTNNQQNTSPINNNLPKDTLSARYSLINTQALINIAEQQGFNVASIKYPRGKNVQYAQHVVRLDLPGYEAQTVGEYRPQIVIKNSHDGTSRICIMGGIFRLVCSNGLVAGKSFLNIRLRHVGLKQQDIEESLQIAAQQVTQLVPLVAKFKAVELSPIYMRCFALDALELRAKVSGLSLSELHSLQNTALEEVLRVRRTEDSGQGLWEVLNRVQENTTKASGLLYTGDDGTFHRLHAVNAIRPNLMLNQGLWELAEKYAA